MLASKLIEGLKCTVADREPNESDIYGYASGSLWFHAWDFQRYQKTDATGVNYLFVPDIRPENKWVLFYGDSPAWKKFQHWAQQFQHNHQDFMICGTKCSVSRALPATYNNSNQGYTKGSLWWTTYNRAFSVLTCDGWVETYGNTENPSLFCKFFQLCNQLCAERSTGRKFRVDSTIDGVLCTIANFPPAYDCIAGYSFGSIWKQVDLSRVVVEKAVLQVGLNGKWEAPYAGPHLRHFEKWASDMLALERAQEGF